MTARLLAAALVAAAAPSTRAEGPLTLDDALAAAAEGNRDLEIARADAASAGADLTAAWSGFLPRLDVTAAAEHDYWGTSRLTYGGVDFGTEPAGDRESYPLQLQARLPLFDGFRSVRQVGSAHAAARAAGRQLDETRLAVAYVVTQRFYELVKQERALAVLEKTAARSEELVQRSDALFAAGRAPKADTIQARVNLGNDRINLEGQRARVARARADLAVALGRSSGMPLEVAPPAALDAPGVPRADLPPLSDLVARARERRPAIDAQNAAVEAAESAVGAARADYFPSIAAVGSYGRESQEPWGAWGTFGRLRNQYSASGQIVLAWTLYDGRRTSAAVQKAEAGAARARASAAKTADQVARDVADARETAAAIQRQLALAADNLAAAEQGLALARQRLEAGLATQLEVRDASLKLTQAELAYLTTRVDHQVALSALDYLVGGALR